MHKWTVLLIACFALAQKVSAQPADVDLVEVGVGFNFAIGVTSSGDGSNRLFIIEQGGRIRVWDGGTTLTTPFLDISTLTSDGGEQGLLGLAFHPQYAVNGQF